MDDGRRKDIKSARSYKEKRFLAVQAKDERTIALVREDNDIKAYTNPLWILEDNKIKMFQSMIIDWYLLSGRSFPWRETNDPFHVLIAEILLKLTGAWKVARVYPTLIRQFGTPQAMANADVQELKTLLRPLGLYERALLLKTISGVLIEQFDEVVPNTYEELSALKGIGIYTANAILCLAYNKRVPLVDGSISRIFTRCFKYNSDKPAYADRQLWELADRFLPNYNHREYNLGLLDLGALICKYKNPNCLLCPISSVCIWKMNSYIYNDFLNLSG